MRPIFLTDEIKTKLLADFTTMLAKSKSFDGKLKIERTMAYNKDEYPRATLWFTPSAWIKMTALVDYFPKEIGWQGFVTRVENTTNEWLVTDIVVYKQIVTGAHVDTDVEEFGPWLSLWTEKADELGCSLNFQGHSHVNMAVSPSGTDLQDQATRMADQKKGFYIFTIQNKSRSANYWIYDFDNNIAYDTADIDVEIFCENELLSEFIDVADGLVTETTYVTKPAAVKPAQSLPAKKPEKKEEKASGDPEPEEDDDLDNPYDYRRYNRSPYIYGDVYPYVSKGYDYYY